MVIKDIVKKIPYIQAILQERHQLVQERDKLYGELANLKQYIKFAPLGHYYSPVPDLDEIRENAERIFGTASAEIPGISLNEQQQLSLLKKFKTYYNELPFQPMEKDNLKYHFENPSYSYSDAIFLYCMIRHFKPKRIIEIGSGYSSCMILDTNDLFFDGLIETKFIEPYPQLLLSLINNTDQDKMKIIEKRLQDVELDEFEILQGNDILFIDSTHVSKVGSDVNRIFFDILPKLKDGVLIHFHDIFYPFEYPQDWIFEGRAWNEAYLLRAFLQYNNSFQVVLMNTFLENFHEKIFQENFPLCLKNTGASIWIRKQNQYAAIAK